MFPIRIRMDCATSTLYPRHADDFRSSILSCPCFTLSSLNPEIQTWIEQLRAGDARALARAISVVENHSVGWSELLKAIFPYSGHARILGLTGQPGAGKSTLVDQLARYYRKEGPGTGTNAL